MSPTDPTKATGAWLVTTGVITPTQFQQLLPYITGRTMVYRVQSIGYTTDGPVGRVAAVSDTNQGNPRCLYYRDLADLAHPRGFPPPGQDQQTTQSPTQSSASGTGGR